MMISLMTTMPLSLHLQHDLQGLDGKDVVLEGDEDLLVLVGQRSKNAGIACFNMVWSWGFQEKHCYIDTHITSK